MDLLGLFARRAESYLHPYGRAATGALLDALATYSPTQILELGCGTGATLVEARLRFPKARIVGIDQRLDMLCQSQRRLQTSGIASVSLVRSHISRLPFKALWSAIYCESVFAILTPREWQRAAQQALKMLEPGGVFVLNEAVWAPDVSEDQAHKLNQKMYKRYGLVQALEAPLNSAEWIAGFRSIGFNVEKDPLCLKSSPQEAPPLTPEAERTLSRSLLFGKEQARRSRRSVDLLRAITLRWNEWTSRKRAVPLDARLFVLRKPQEEPHGRAG